MAHVYTVATTILVDIVSEQELEDREIRHVINECDYSVTGTGSFPGETAANRYEITDTEMEDWTLVAEREQG